MIRFRWEGWETLLDIFSFSFGSQEGGLKSFGFRVFCR